MKLRVLNRDAAEQSPCCLCGSTTAEQELTVDVLNLVATLACVDGSACCRRRAQLATERQRRLNGASV